MSYPATLTDGYKIGHVDQYQQGTTQVVANWTPRKSRIKGIDKVVFFTQQAFIKKYLIKQFNEEFFALDEETAVKKYYRRIKNYLPEGAKIRTDHIRALHQLGYLPICIMSLPEGVSTPIRVPQSILFCTHKDFFWLTNYFETLYSCEIWKACTSATIAKEYKKIFDYYAHKTVGNIDFTQFQGHDFSMRGMSGLADAQASGAAHLLAFRGSDTIPAIDWLEEYYNADCEKELIGCSVAATEHAVMCSSTGFYIWDKYNQDWTYQGEAELAVFKRLITETYPTGIVSIVSDTWNLWKVLTEYCRILKDVIMAREGKLVFRPDSGDPVDILCGYANKEGYTVFERDGKLRLRDNTTHISKEISEAENKGVIELLYETFGGTKTDTGYILLDSHVGAIYGDSITMQRAVDICERLMQKNFASINWVAGIGSFTYQYTTRDVFGYAMKSTYCEVEKHGCKHCTEIDAEEAKDITENCGSDKCEFKSTIYQIPIFKDPITDDGTKKSAKGLIAVYKDAKGEYYLKDMATWEEVMNCEFKIIFKDSKLLKDYTLQEVRDNFNACK